MTKSQRQRLSRRAIDLSLEVEHLLFVAPHGAAADVPFLRELKEKHAWSMTGKQGRARVVPFGMWCEALCRFWERGYRGLAKFAGESSRTQYFAVSILEHIKTPESVQTLLEIGRTIGAHPTRDLPRAVELASGFNFLLSFKGSPAIAPPVERRVRDFLHRLLAQKLNEAQRATVVCALRGVGDTESLHLIAALPKFTGCWAKLELTAARQIRQRLKQQ